MPTDKRPAVDVPRRLRTARVIAVQEQSCQVWDAGELTVHRFAPMFPSPRVERVSPGHLVAIASSPSGADAVVWRWYDAVVLGTVVPESADGGSVRLWEPAHGEVTARARETYEPQLPGTRAWASAGLPGAEWWVSGATSTEQVELDEVDAMYATYEMWPAVFTTTDE